MKKLLSILLTTLMVLILVPTSITAEETGYRQFGGDAINDIVKDYLSSRGYSSTLELTDNEKMQLIVIVNELKERDPELQMAKQYTNPISTKASNIYEYMGYVFVTGDSSTHGFEHGHAGIGASTPESVIESDKVVGVKQYGNRVSSYWSKHNSSIMAVRGAEYADYSAAHRYANNQIGKPYSLSITDGESAFYCSELVAVAWYKAGIRIDPGLYVYVMPYDLYTNGNTITVKSFGSGY